MLRLWTKAASTSRTSHRFWCQKRCLSTSQFDPSIRDFTSALISKQPAFQVQPSTVHILRNPAQFYDTLLEMINKAERRIFISSLYIGSEETELIDALSRRLRERRDLKLQMVLDLNRSTRPGRDSTAKILLPLLQEFPSRVTISMFRSPSLRGIMAKIVPPRFNEGWGTWHAKIYGVDEDVMISGANLNKSYFTDRQDRYLYFTSQKHLAQYCHDFMEIVGSFSYRLLPSVSSSTPLMPAPSNPHSYSHDDYTLCWPNFDTHPHHFNSIAETALSQFQKSQCERSRQLGVSDPKASAEMPILIPIIQAGQFNVREEESTFQLLFRHLAKFTEKRRPLLDLTSGYFSLYRPYQDLVLNAPNVDCRIVASSPKANGFYGSKGISGRIPEGYTLYEQRFMRAVAKAGRLWRGNGQGVLLTEWEKPGWTYHAKGIWLSLTSSTSPILTLFGSTNLNSRSAHIDTELSFLMILPSETEPSTAAAAVTDPSDTSPTDSSLSALRRDLALEIEGIRSNATSWKGGERKVRWTTKVIVWLVKGML
ncbi:phospholipase D/nuclease [Pholiota conissans]|uniref:CDP-diacylglycerol--glycerol-3-phosphate 3-phosphatidyltransferase n=1 Tax=Pholiota conissans TaxID=109636 RepID=A0A9P6CVU2_9AGAR|nr:phospholipase D/nuclease [Pholiota conissans]